MEKFKSEDLENVSGGFNNLQEADAWFDETLGSFYDDVGLIPLSDEKGHHVGDVHLYHNRSDGKFYTKNTSGIYEEYKY